DREARVLACLALGESRPAGDEAVRAVAAALKDPDAGQRGAARQALVVLGPAAVPALVAALKNGEPRAALARGRREPPAAAAVPALIAALKAPDKEVRLEIHEALVRLGPAAVPAMAEALGDADVRTWHSLSVALGKIGPAASAAAPALT